MITKKQLVRTLSIGLLGVLPISTFSASDAQLRFASMRSLAMGGVGVTIETNEHALYRNPASLSTIPEPDFNALRYRVGANQGILDDTEIFSDLLNPDLDESGRIGALSDLAPSSYITDISFAPLGSIVAPGFAMAGFSNFSTEISILNKAQPRVEVSITGDTIGLIGFSSEFDFLPEDWTVGFSAGGYVRTIVFDSDTGESKFVWDSTEFLDAVDGNSNPDLSVENAIGYGLNLGLLAPLDWDGSKGHWGLAINNIGTILESDNVIDGSDEIEIPLTATLGLSLAMDLPFIGDALVAADYQIVSPEDSFYLNAHLGIEKKFWDTVILRGGVNQGYIVGGVGIDLGLLRIDYVNTTEELGTFAGQNSGTRHIVQLGLIF